MPPPSRTTCAAPATGASSGIRRSPASTRARDARFTIAARPFLDTVGEEPGGTIRVRISSEARVESLVDAQGEPLEERRIEGVVLGGFYPESGRDREPVRLDALPAYLVDAVLAIEDQRFFDHAGFDLRRTAGAMSRTCAPVASSRAAAR